MAGSGEQASEGGIVQEPCLGVAMPVFNEERWLDTIVSRVLEQEACSRLVIVDDGSTDGTPGILDRLKERDGRIEVLRHPANRGKGAAVRTALQALDTPYVLIQDADLEYDPGEYPRLLAPLLRGEADVVYGSRFLESRNQDTPAWHRLQNRLLTGVANYLTRLQLTDEATCYKLFTRRVIDSIELTSEGFDFCPEVTAKVARLVHRNEARLVEVPIGYRHRSLSEGKKLRLRDGAMALYSLWKHTRS